VPRDWFPADLAGAQVLGLASGGGQQGPVLAAAGAAVTVFDNSPAQLGRDEEVAAREGLEIRTVLGDMRDLSALRDASFDVVFNPVSNVFCPELAPVWRECCRVLRPGGILLAGFMNPDIFVFDPVAHERGELVARCRLPFRSLDLPQAERERAQPRSWLTRASACSTVSVGPRLGSGSTRLPPARKITWSSRQARRSGWRSAISTWVRAMASWRAAIAGTTRSLNACCIFRPILRPRKPVAAPRAAAAMSSWTEPPSRAASDRMAPIPGSPGRGGPDRGFRAHPGAAPPPGCGGPATGSAAHPGVGPSGCGAPAWGCAAYPDCGPAGLPGC
jgi:SAM-dependent methyltransferase